MLVVVILMVMMTVMMTVMMMMMMMTSWIIHVQGMHLMSTSHWQPWQQSVTARLQPAALPGPNPSSTNHST